MIDLGKAATFKRGSTFKFRLELPAAVEDGAFLDWIPSAQIRRHGDDVNEDALIATIPIQWEDPAVARVLTVSYNDTDNWPLGIADFDVLLTKDGVRIHSTTLHFNIERSVTKGA